MITQSVLKELIFYNKELGTFVCRKTAKIIGRIDNKGYLILRINGNDYQAHRIVFLYTNGTFPKKEVDHINCIRSDNSYANLRLATHSENQRNKYKQKNNTSGYKGVVAKGKFWQSQISINKKMKYLGIFINKEDAYLAYCSASKFYHGEFSNV